MCDCYQHKCEKCDAVVPMHLGDYSTGRDEIEVYCGKHIPKNTTRGTLWEWSDEEVVASDVKAWEKCFVKWLTKNAEDEDYDNGPNAWNTRRL